MSGRYKDLGSFFFLFCLLEFTREETSSLSCPSGSTRATCPPSHTFYMGILRAGGGRLCVCFVLFFPCQPPPTISRCGSPDVGAFKKKQGFCFFLKKNPSDLLKWIQNGRRTDTLQKGPARNSFCFCFFYFLKQANLYIEINCVWK